jgi:hypothetical protein
VLHAKPAKLGGDGQAEGPGADDCCLMLEHYLFFTFPGSRLVARLCATGFAALYRVNIGKDDCVFYTSLAAVDWSASHTRRWACLSMEPKSPFHSRNKSR